MLRYVEVTIGSLCEADYPIYRVNRFAQSADGKSRTRC